MIPAHAVSAAAAWWASRLGNATHDAGMSTMADMELTVSLNAETARGSRTPLEREAFRAALEEAIARHCLAGARCGDMRCSARRHVVGVDYEPDELLQAAADLPELGLERGELPVKTTMLLYADRVTVSEGYAAPWVNIWPPEGNLLAE